MMTTMMVILIIMMTMITKMMMKMRVSLDQVIVLYLILRGLLPLPWLEPTSEAACLQDSLGRFNHFKTMKNP